MNKPTRKPYTFAIHTSQRLAQNCKRVCLLPTLKKMLTKLKETERIKKAQGTTKAIRNAGKILNMKLIAINKISSKLKVWCFKIPHYA